MQSFNIKGIILVMLSAILFGLMPMLAKFAYQENVNVLSVLFYRYLFAFIMMAIFVFFRKVNLRINTTQCLILSLASIVGTVLTTYTLFLSYKYISSGLASTLHFIYPMITTILSALIYREQFNKSKAVALGLSFTGIFLLTINDNINVNVWGIIWALASGVLYSIYIICIAHDSFKKMSPYVVAFYVFGFSALIFLLPGLFTGELNYPISTKAVFYIANLSFWATFLSVILFFVGMQITGPGNAAILSTLEPMTGVITGILIFKENLSETMFAGSILVITSVIVIAQSHGNKISPYHRYFKRSLKQTKHLIMKILFTLHLK